MKYRFATDCVSANGDDIIEMIAVADSISRDTFLIRAAKYGFKDEVLEMLGYSEWGRDAKKAASTLFKNDFGVSCAESYYQGVPCLYVRWSGIEHIWIPNDKCVLSEEAVETRRAKIDNLASDIEDGDFDNDAKLFKKFIQEKKDELKEHRIPPAALLHWQRPVYKTAKKLAKEVLA